ncbi:MAG: TolC family protein, partial [Segatella salivae]
MKNITRNLIITAACMALPAQLMAKEWTLKACIDYALQNNITLQKSRLNQLAAKEDIKESQAALLPSLSLGTSQNVSYNPWPETNSYVVAGNRVETSVDKAYYNGGYSLSANWTVWNGNRNHNQVKLNKFAEKQADLAVASDINTLTEQITQLFVQILYSNEAIKVNQESLATSAKNEERGKEMLAVGKMSKADLAQLTAQRAQDEYAIVQAESNLKEYKRQLKQLLQLTNGEAFDVVVPETTDAMALELIPNVSSVYEQALTTRPEIKNAELSIQSSELNIKLANSLRMPTIAMSAGISTNTSTMNKNGWDKQMKNNFVIGGGINISVPLLDNRQAKTTISKAEIQRQNS